MPWRVNLTLLAIALAGNLAWYVWDRNFAGVIGLGALGVLLLSLLPPKPVDAPPAETVTPPPEAILTLVQRGAFLDIHLGATGMSGAELVALLRRAADGIEHGDRRLAWPLN